MYVISEKTKTLAAINTIKDCISVHEGRKELMVQFLPGRGRKKIPVKQIDLYELDKKTPFGLAKDHSPSLPIAVPKSYLVLYIAGLEFAARVGEFDRGAILIYLRNNFDCPVTEMTANLKWRRDKDLRGTLGVFSLIAHVDAVLFGIADPGTMGGFSSARELEGKILTAKGEIKTKFVPLLDDLQKQIDSKADQKDLDIPQVELGSKADKAEVASIKVQLDTKASIAEVDSKADKKDLDEVRDAFGNKVDQSEFDFFNWFMEELDTKADKVDLAAKADKKDLDHVRDVENKEPQATQPINLCHSIYFELEGGIYLGVIPSSPFRGAARFGIALHPLDQHSVSLSRKPNSYFCAKVNTPHCVVCDWKVNGSVFSCGTVLKCGTLIKQVPTTSGPLASEYLVAQDGVKNVRTVFTQHSNQAPTQNFVFTTFQKLQDATEESHGDRLGHGSVVLVKNDHHARSYRLLLLGPSVSDQEH